jgi:two-component system sensor histidine kinase MprB
VNLRTRVALAGGAVVICALSLVAAILYPAVEAGMRGQIDSSLVLAAHQAPELTRQVKAKMAVSGGKAALGDVVLTIGTTAVHFDPAPVAAGPDAKFVDLTGHDVLVADGTDPPYFRDARFDGSLYRVYAAPLAGVPGALVRTARPESDPAPVLNELAWLLLWLTLGAGLVAAAVARFAARRVLSPVGGLIGTVEHITATGDLTASIEASGRDEIGRLGRAFATMTAALDESVGAQRRLVADASHELRTPLTSLTTNLELIAEKPADAQVPALAAEALSQAQELKALINDLVDLARYGQQEPHTEDVRLDLVAERAAARAGRGACGGRVAVDVEACPVLVHGDPDALERAVANLVDNAVKFSPDGGRVHVRVSAQAAHGVIEVSDTGPGIPTADLPFIFDRFYRSPAARALPGSGLGLAIVRRITESHRGDVEAVPLDRGVLLRIRIPALADKTC